MQIRAKMENIAIHVPRNGVFPTLPTTWLLNSTGKKKNPSSTENPSSYICDIPCYLFISKCFSKWQKREISISNKEEIQANLNPHSSIHVSPLGVYSLFNLRRFDWYQFPPLFPLRTCPSGSHFQIPLATKTTFSTSLTKENRNYNRTFTPKSWNIPQYINIPPTA